MFGSNFDANFGIPAFPVQGLDPQGGMFGTTAPPSGPTGGPAPTAPPVAGPPAAPAGGPPSLGDPSPLSSGVLAPEGAAAPPSAALPDQNQGAGNAPAAGIGSPFGKPGG